MNKFTVVTVHRDCWRFPKLTIKVEATVASMAAGRKYIERRVLEQFTKRLRGKFGAWASMRVFDFRVVDELGLKRLLAAAKASRTIRRRRAAQKAAATRAKKKAANMSRTAAARAANASRFQDHGAMKGPVIAEFFPVASDPSLN